MLVSWGFNEDFELIPDILEKIEIEDDRYFITLYLREKRHKWSDGVAFTSEAFRYFWARYSYQ